MRDRLLFWLALIAVIMASSYINYISVCRKIDKQTEIIMQKIEQKNRLLEQDISLLLNEKVLR